LISAAPRSSGLFDHRRPAIHLTASRKDSYSRGWWRGVKPLPLQLEKSAHQDHVRARRRPNSQGEVVSRLSENRRGRSISRVRCQLSVVSCIPMPTES
jgi:hypothetical protein